MTRISLAALVTALIGLCGPAMAQQLAQQQATPPVGPDFSKIEVKTTDLGNRTYMLEGFGGNVTVAVGDDGVIMVDGQFAPMHDKLKAAIAAITPQPIKYLINTHHHGDHTGGNLAFAKDGVTIVAHENVRKRLAAGTTHNLSGITTPPAPAEALPAKTYTDAMTLEVKGRSAQLKHPLNAHTDGDTYVYFADANVLATGDSFANGRYPNSDFLNGGNLKGMIAADDAYLALVNDTTKIVPGHGPLATKAQLAEFRAMLETSRERMAKLIAEGKSEADIYAAKPFADLDAKWAVNEQASKNWIRVVYYSLKQ
jgi:glyoxylase-like metal-dependent hydrolase (beta-lactamase superfamily II)